MTINLKTMTRKELAKLIGDAEKALVAAEERERREALEAAEKAAAEFGFPLKDLLGDGGKKRGSGKSRAKSKPKFRDPKNAENTWSGRGRKPQWFHDALAQGKSPADLAV